MHQGHEVPDPIAISQSTWVLSTQRASNVARVLLLSWWHFFRDIFCSRSYSYYIEVSMDQKDWVRVIDHTHYFCRSWQYLYFAPRVVRYIRIVGTNNTVNKVFHVVSFEAMFTHNNVELQNGLIGKFMLSIMLLLCFPSIVKPWRASPADW